MTSKTGWIMRMAWFAAFAGPPIAVLAAWRAQAAHIPVLTVALLIIYEGVIAIWRLAAGVLSGLAARWREQLIEYLDTAFKRHISRFERRYRDFVLAGSRFLDQKGLATVAPFTPQLDQVYIDVSLALRAPNQATTSPIESLVSQSTQRRHLEEFLDRPEGAVLAVIGGPGTGKTTLLRHVADRVCSQGHRRRNIPVLLYLRDHIAAISTNSNVSLSDLLCRTLGQLSSRAPDGWLEQKLYHGHCVVLLDGLDEVARQEDRTNVSTWIGLQIQQYPHNDFVITSRPHGYRAAPIDGATVLQVRNLTADQITTFVHAWYLAMERHRTGVDTEDVELRAKAGADDLIDRLKDSPAVYDLTVNPLLLTMVANVHLYRGALPGNRAELYGEICQVMLWRRQVAKKLRSDISGEKKQAVLAAVAFTMMEERVRDLSRAAVLTAIELAMRRLPTNVSPQDFLDGVESNGLIIERESGVYAFSHQTFQEFLAATHVHNQGIATALAANVDDVWWRETTLLYTSRADADVVVSACLASPTANAIILAFDCIDQGSSLAPELRVRLDALSRTVFDPGSDSERRDLITSALLIRHLRDRVLSKEASRICKNPISEDLYRLFLDETKHPARDAFTPPVADVNAAVGMRGRDAVVFTTWVNERIGGEMVYRLPRESELEGLPDAETLAGDSPDSAGYSEWTQSREGFLALHVPETRKHPFAVDYDSLVGHVRNDILLSVPTIVRVLLVQAMSSAHVIAEGLQLAQSRGWPLGRVDFRAADFMRMRRKDLRLGQEMAEDVVRVIGRTLDRSLLRSLDKALGLDLDPRDKRRSNARVLAYASEVEGLYSRAQEESKGLSRALGTSLSDRAMTASVRTHDLNRIAMLSRALKHAMDVAPSSSGNQSLDLKSALGHAIELSHEIGGSSIAIGSALSIAIEETRNATQDKLNWAARLADEFIRLTLDHEATYVVYSDSLSDITTTAVAEFKHVRKASRAVAPSSWAFQVADRFEKLAVPLFDRRGELDSSAVTRIRLVALCLAVEADCYEKEALARSFREIAAGITLLGQRMIGDIRAREIIVLAVE